MVLARVSFQMAMVPLECLTAVKAPGGGEVYRYFRLLSSLLPAAWLYLSHPPRRSPPGGEETHGKAES